MEVSSQEQSFRRAKNWINVENRVKIKVLSGSGSSELSGDRRQVQNRYYGNLMICSKNVNHSSPTC